MIINRIENAKSWQRSILKEKILIFILALIILSKVLYFFAENSVS